MRRVQQAIALAHRTLHAAAAEREHGTAATTAALGSGVTAAGARPLQFDKVVAESAMLARCAFIANPGDATLAAAVSALALELAPHARGVSVQALVCGDPAGALGHAAAHVYLASIGHADSDFDAFLSNVLAAERVGGPERLPNQQLEWHWLGQIRAGAAATARAERQLLARTCAALPLDVLGSSTLDLYVFAHVVMYASDMGHRAPSWPRDVAATAAEAEAALAAALDADNLDLAAELLWTWPMLRVPWSSSATFAFQLLCAAQDEDDFLPGPGFDRTAAAALPEADRAAYLQRTSYHATFVMGILCAAMLRPGRAPRPRPGLARAPGRLTAETAAAPLRTPRWATAHAALDPASRSEMEPFVLDMQLRRAAAAHAYAAMRGLLETTVVATWAERPSVRQAVSLLQRVTAMAALAERNPARA